ncbi:helix-turn-helix domain-containing protein [Enterococcus sp. N249-2]
MDEMMKKCITEKDLLRQILLLETLANHQQITAKELAALLHTTERTIFSDIISIRQQLPDNWLLAADNNGLSMQASDSLPVSQLWEIFFPQSIGISLLKALLFAKEIGTQAFTQENGISLETLRRHTLKINQTLVDFSIRIRVTASKIYVDGNEINLRLFYHRLLLPYTHNNYFFSEYTIHESHYYDFLAVLGKQAIEIDVEQVFGTCWFFINTIRIKASCRIDDFPFDTSDRFFGLFQQPLLSLYEKEGVYLETSEHFFSFYCFLESWNYNNLWSPLIQEALLSYTPIYAQAKDFVDSIDDALHLALIQQTRLVDNLTLLLIKVQESRKLSVKFQLEYQDIRDFNYPQLAAIDTLIQSFIDTHFTKTANLQQSIALTIRLLIQQARLQADPIIAKGLFVFQGEPAWKVYLLHELKDFLGRRIALETVEPGQLDATSSVDADFILSNFPIEAADCPIYYLSMVPTKNELSQVTELIQSYYLNYR